MNNLPKKYRFLLDNPLPPLMVRNAMDLLGTLEGPGTTNNRKIVAWADEVADVMPSPYNNWAADWYNSDAIPWCGLFMAVVAVRSSQGRPERMPPAKYLSALAWANYGEAVQWKGKEGLRLGEIAIGDVLVFVRNGGGHVGLCVGVSKDGRTVFVLGGNQSNRVSIAEIAVNRLYAVRRPPYNQRPAGARHVRLDTTGVVSKNEA